jgi:hypothetical protein
MGRTPEEVQRLRAQGSRTYGRNGPSQGQFGRIFIASDYAAALTLQGRSAEIGNFPEHIFIHELGNILSAKHTGNARTFGDPHAEDQDTGDKLEHCVFGK